MRMEHGFRKLVFPLVASVALATSTGAGAPTRTEPGSLDPTRIAQLAQAIGLGGADLEVLDSTTEILLDGRRIERFKALDRATGELVGGAFEDGSPIDLVAAERAAGEAWRRSHGALTPALRDRLGGLAAEDPLPVVVWLKSDLSAIPDARPDLRLATPAGSTAAGVAAQDEAPAPGEPAAAPESEEKPRGSQSPFLSAADVTERRARQAALAQFDGERAAAVRAVLAPAREAFVARAVHSGFVVRYASDLAPMAVVEGPRRAIEEMAFWPEVDTLYDGSGHGGPSLQYARPTQNVTAVNDVGYNGSGVAVSVTEGERGYAANPYLSWAGFYDAGQPFASHPTAVGGIVRSTHPTQHGLADGVTLYSANGSYGDFGVMSAAMDWGSTNARVLNNSWYWEPDSDTSDFWAADRHQDWFVRFHFDSVMVASGNFGNGCDGNFSPYVVSPAKGYNVVAVGNFDDHDSIGWSGDDMNFCSSFGDPDNDNGTGTLDKPEIAGAGTAITSTLTSSDPNAAVGAVGSGTSYASPMVVATAADMMEADPGIEINPEAVKAVLMATALHNIEGASDLSDKDGTGGLVGAAAVVSVERGHWQDELIGSGTSFPITKSQFAYRGEKVRFVVAWSSNPNASYTTDPLPADIDLGAYRADGTTLLASSTSFFNSFEIVEFTAPASEVYQFRISLFSADWSSGNTWMGTGWWRGEYRISPDVPYTDPHPPATGTHLAVHPTDWTPTNYWRAFGIRPNAGSDYDLEVATRSLFEDPGQRTVLDISAFGSTTPDFIVIDGNHWNPGSAEHYRVLRFSGTSGYDLNFSNLGAGAGNGSVVLGPVTMTASEVVKVFDVFVPARSHRRIEVVTVAGGGDLGLRTFRSNGADSTTWEQERSDAQAARNRHGSGTATERIGIVNPSSVGDWLGLVVEKFDEGSVTFQVVVYPASIFSDGFESGDTSEWSATTP